jgi:hypothetical protein
VAETIESRADFHKINVIEDEPMLTDERQRQRNHEAFERWMGRELYGKMGVPKKLLKSNIDGFYDCPKCSAPVVSGKGEWLIPKYFIGDDCLGFRCNCGNIITGADLMGITKKDESTLRALGVPEDTLTMIFGKPKESKPKVRPRRRITIPKELKLRREGEGNG